MPSTPPPDDDPRAAARLEHQLHRLEALAARRRYRIALRRGLRGALGAGLTLIAALKLKLAGSLVLKLGLALAVGLAVAWPVYALGALFVASVLLSLFACESDVCDCPCDCARKEKRRERLDRLIDERRAMLYAASAAIRSGARPDPTARS